MRISDWSSDVCSSDLTQHAGFGCALRTVVLRKVDSEARELWFYTDLRSRKIGEIQDDPRIALLFHSLSDDTQLRVQAEATIHHSDALAEAAWRALKPRPRRDYLVSGPRGLPWAWATSGLGRASPRERVGQYVST